MLEFDIKGLFDNIDHERLLKALRKHTQCKWELLYIQRWLIVPFREEGGALKARNSGVPQGGVISPLLANLFLHYAFDTWMTRNWPLNPWARYADDGLVHCRTNAEAQVLLKQLEARFREVGLELNRI